LRERRVDRIAKEPLPGIHLTTWQRRDLKRRKRHFNEEGLRVFRKQALHRGRGVRRERMGVMGWRFGGGESTGSTPARSRNRKHLKRKTKESRDQKSDPHDLHALVRRNYSKQKCRKGGYRNGKDFYSKRVDDHSCRAEKQGTDLKKKKKDRTTTIYSEKQRELSRRPNPGWPGRSEKE